MICPLCEKGELFPVTHADGEHSWRCKWCGKLLSEHYWEEMDGRLVKRDEKSSELLSIKALDSSEGLAIMASAKRSAIIIPHRWGRKK